MIGVLLGALLAVLFGVFLGTAAYVLFVGGLPKLREPDRGYIGPFSTYAEWHAATIGIYHGLTTRPWRVKPGDIPDHPDVRKETHYYKGAFVAGSVLQVVMLVIVASVFGAIPSV